MKSAEVKQIESFSEAIQILSLANARNNCAWAETKVRHAYLYLDKQQTAVCQFHFSEDRVTDSAVGIQPEVR